jgi:hypothetical protein
MLSFLSGSAKKEEVKRDVGVGMALEIGGRCLVPRVVSVGEWPEDIDAPLWVSFSCDAGGSAEWSGKIKLGDCLLAVNGTSVAGRQLSEIGKQIKGPDLTEVVKQAHDINSKFCTDPWVQIFQHQ